MCNTVKVYRTFLPLIYEQSFDLVNALELEEQFAVWCITSGLGKGPSTKHPPLEVAWCIQVFFVW